jgi:hypothetical protein
MRHAVSNEIYAYWRALGKGGCPPERNAVEPGAIRGVLADTFVLDFDPTGGFPFRISGSNVNALFMKELRGAPFLQIWRETDRAGVASILEAAADEETPCVVVAEARPAGLAAVGIEVTLLPLRHQGATHARMLGSLTAGARPDWLGLIGAGHAALKAYRKLEADAPGPRREATPLRQRATFGAPVEVRGA